MATFKVTFFVEGQQQSVRYSAFNAGWSETWYLTAGGLTYDSVLQSNAVDNYILYRTRCMAPIYQIPWVRASQITNDAGQPILLRASKTRALTSAAGSLPDIGTGPTRQADAGQVTCALLIRFTKLPNDGEPVPHHRLWLMRGLPQSIINSNVLFTGGAAFPAVRNFMNYVGFREIGVTGTGTVISSWQLRYTPASAARFNVSSLIVDADGGKVVRINAPGAPAVVQGEKMTVQGVKFPRGMNRTWTVLQDCPAGGPYVLGTSRTQLAGTWNLSQGGKVRVARFGYGIPDQYLPIGLRHRDTGRPFDLTRGRRRGG